MQVDIDKIFEYLSWNNTDNIQAIGMDMARRIKNLSVLIRPKGNKSIWENCAKILAEKNDNELKLYLTDLFMWLQDMNWPGSDVIYNRLVCTFNEDIFIAYKYSLSVAIQTNDYAWKQILKKFYIEHILNLYSNLAYFNDKLQNDTTINGKESSIILCNFFSDYIKILLKYSDIELKNYLVELMETLEYLSYPETIIIFERLVKYKDDDSYSLALKLCINTAKNNDNKKLLQNLNLLDSNRKRYQKE